ncbi:hypothetical protein ACFLTK_01550 [Chloroflexota bacterium]
MELTKRIKKVALASHMDYIGISPAERLENETEKLLRPRTFLPDAQSVVSMGINMNIGTQLAHKMAYHYHQRNAIFIYRWSAFNQLNFHLDRVVLLVARLIEAENEQYVAVGIPSSSPFDLRTSLTEFSNIHAAVAAGLGDLGWNGFALNAKTGPRVRYVSVITNAKLEPAPIYNGPKLCEPEKCGYICAKICPTGALGSDSEKRVIGGTSFDVAKFDRWRCLWGCMGLSDGSLALKSIPMPDRVELDDITKALAQRDFRQTQESIPFGTGDYCGKCIVECPVGARIQLLRRY